MYFASSLWDQALSAAGDILSDLIGNLLGWLIVLALLSPLVVIVYFILKKAGWRRLYRDPYSKKGFTVRMSLNRPIDSEVASPSVTDPGTLVEIRDAQGEVLSPTDPNAQEKLQEVIQQLSGSNPEMAAKLKEAVEHSTEAGMPDWHQQLIAKWQRERDELAHEEHELFVQDLRRNRANLQAFIRPVRYAVAGLCALAALACLFWASHGDSRFGILALVFLGCAVGSWYIFDPSDYD